MVTAQCGGLLDGESFGYPCAEEECVVDLGDGRFLRGVKLIGLGEEPQEVLVGDLGAGALVGPVDEPVHRDLESPGHALGDLEGRDPDRTLVLGAGGGVDVGLGGGGGVRRTP